MPSKNIYSDSFSFGGRVLDLNPLPKVALYVSEIGPIDGHGHWYQFHIYSHSIFPDSVTRLGKYYSTVKPFIFYITLNFWTFWRILL